MVPLARKIALLLSELRYARLVEGGRGVVIDRRITRHQEMKLQIVRPRYKGVSEKDALLTRGKGIKFIPSLRRSPLS
jgi:hypothetical protein